MGILKSLFGGETTQTTEFDVPPELQAALNQSLSQGTEAFSQPFQEFTGDRFAEFTPDQLSAFNQIRGFSDPNSLSSRVSEQNLGRFLSPPTTEDLQPFLNPYLQNTLDIAKRRNTDAFDTQLNKARNSRDFQSAYGGSRMGVREGELGEAFLNSQSDLEYQALSDAYNQGIGQYYGSATQGIAGANAADSGTLNRINALSGIGGQQQAFNQAQSDFGYSEFMRGINEPKEDALSLARLTAMYPTNIIDSKSTSYESPGLLNSIGGLASTVGGIPGLGSVGKAVGKAVGGLFGGGGDPFDAIQSGKKDGGLITREDKPKYSTPFSGGAQGYQSGGAIRDPREDIFGKSYRSFMGPTSPALFGGFPPAESASTGDGSSGGGRDGGGGGGRGVDSDDAARRKREEIFNRTFRTYGGTGFNRSDSSMPTPTGDGSSGGGRGGGGGGGWGVEPADDALTPAPTPPQQQRPAARPKVNRNNNSIVAKAEPVNPFAELASKVAPTSEPEAEQEDDRDFMQKWMDNPLAKLGFTLLAGMNNPTGRSAAKLITEREEEITEQTRQEELAEQRRINAQQQAIENQRAAMAYQMEQSQHEDNLGLNQERVDVARRQATSAEQQAKMRAISRQLEQAQHAIDSHKEMLSAVGPSLEAKEALGEEIKRLGEEKKRLLATFEKMAGVKPTEIYDANSNSWTSPSELN